VPNTKIKNNLLALTLVLTGLPVDVRISKTVVESISFSIGQYLNPGERTEVSW
jgi:hypothetical protein